MKQPLDLCHVPVAHGVPQRALAVERKGHEEKKKMKKNKAAWEAAPTTEPQRMAGDAGADDAAGPVVTRVLHDQILHLTKRKHDMFVSNHGMRPMDVEAARRLRMSVKTRDEYWAVKDLPPPPGAVAAATPEEGEDAAAKAHLKQKAVRSVHEQEAEAERAAAGDEGQGAAGGPAGQLAVYKPQGAGGSGSTALMVRAGKSLNMPKPEWHAPWKAYILKSSLILTSLSKFAESLTFENVPGSSCASSPDTWAGCAASASNPGTSGLQLAPGTELSKSGTSPPARILKFALYSAFIC